MHTLGMEIVSGDLSAGILESMNMDQPPYVCAHFPSSRNCV